MAINGSNYATSMAAYGGISSINNLSSSASLMPQKIKIKTSLAEKVFDGFLDITHSYTNVITKHPVQAGAEVTDHAYTEPVTLSMNIIMSDSNSDIISGDFSGSISRSKTAFLFLRDLLTTRATFTVTTRLATYSNMMMQNLTINDSLETLDGLDATVSLQQLLIAQEKTVKISKRVSTTNKTTMGELNVTKTDMSALAAITSSLKKFF